MGYNTNYKILSVEPQNIAALERAFSLHGIARDGYDWFGVGVESESITWYEHEVHIADAMIESGVTKLVLHGEGDSQGDVWDKTFGVDELGRVWVQQTKYKLVPGAPESPTQVATCVAGWSREAEAKLRDDAGRAGGRKRLTGCMSNECAIRNACTGHISCPGGLYRG